MAAKPRSGGVVVDFEPMSPEDRERMMQFLLNQQAQYAADFAMSLERLGRVESALVGLTGIVGRVADVQEQAERRMERLAEAQARTEEHLGIVVTMFERHLREDHGAH
jgi:hypothetical protein